MGEITGISWCDRTWSPWIGCTKVSPACDGCYAAHLMDTRLGRVEWGPHGERRRTSKAYWRNPVKWDREARAAGRMISVFPSLCDPFDNQADPTVRREWFALMRATPNLLWLLLTKRPQNIVRMAEAVGGLPANAALGATCEDQERADRNVPALLDAKARLGARMAFLSCEPLLGPIDLTAIRDPLHFPGLIRKDCLLGRQIHEDDDDQWTTMGRLDWVITGGETDQGSHKARPTHPAWFRQIRDTCAAAGVPYHHKQNGEWRPYDVRGVGVSSMAWMRDCGRFEPWAFGLSGDAPNDERARWAAMARAGKSRAGRLLDGVLHDALPSAFTTPVSEAQAPDASDQGRAGA